MSFSCSIFQNGKDIANDKIIHAQLYGLGPSNSDDEDAPFSLDDFRSVVANFPYAGSHKLAAQDCFKKLQRMAKANLESLKKCHCETCTCSDTVPEGWSTEAVKRLIEIDASTITKVAGGY